MDERERKREDRIREVAHRIWREEGCPHGRHEQHWQMARDLVAIEEGYESALKPADEKLGPYGEPVEEAKLEENLGEFPTLTDQGEQQPPGRSASGAQQKAPIDQGEAAQPQAAAAPKRRRATSRAKKGV
jgi:hypothetical protein